MPDHHSHTGFGMAPEGSRSTGSRMTVPAMMGSSPEPVQAARRVSLGCSRSHASAVAVP
jgi:hypothetical protein